MSTPNEFIVTFTFYPRSSPLEPCPVTGQYFNAIQLLVIVLLRRAGLINRVYYFFISPLNNYRCTDYACRSITSLGRAVDGYLCQGSYLRFSRISSCNKRNKYIHIFHFLQNLVGVDQSAYCKGGDFLLNNIYFQRSLAEVCFPDPTQWAGNLSVIRYIIFSGQPVDSLDWPLRSNLACSL